MRRRGLGLAHVGIAIGSIGIAASLAIAASAAGHPQSGTTTGFPSAGAPSVVPGAPPARDPIHSAVVLVAGTSVQARFAALAGPMASAEESLARAEALDGALDAAEAEVARRQAPVVAAAQGLGIDVISRYRTVANALLVHGTAEQLAALARRPDVVAIEPAPLVRPALARSVPRIRADVLASQLGFTGSGSVVAVVDAGIDYTHAHFGGPGTPEAYAAANGAAERIDDQWQGAPLFPTAKVIGGWDFVGPKYTHPNYCTDDMVREGRCANQPQPDPDPLDQHGHGTHVAGIVAGNAVGDLANGVAPGAKLVALKIYGTPPGLSVDESIDVVVDAIEWCAKVNLGRTVEGIAPPHVDAINMSLGEPFAQGSRLLDQAVQAAVDTGIVVVASAGNEYDRPFDTGAPGASPKVLSVASTVVAGGERDLISDFSARGPSKNGALKPDLAAPGSGIFSASMGTGSSGKPLGGTSMASPHVAGAAALLQERNRVQKLGLGATDIAALLMNYAIPQVTANDGSPLGVTRQGAGRIDLLRAGTAGLLVRAGDIASVNIGAVALTGGPNGLSTERAALSVRNLTDADQHVQLSARFLRADDAGKGVVVEVPDEPVTIPARSTVEVPVIFHFTPELLRDWPLLDDIPVADAGTMDTLEIDGIITLTPVEAAGTVLPDVPAPGVPFYVLPRRASAIRSIAAVAPPADGEGRLTFENSGQEGSFSLFTLPAGPAQPDPDEPEVTHELDLQAVGVHFVSIPDGADNVVFGVSRHATAPIPQATSLEIYLDLDRDGRIDQRVRTVSASLVRGGRDDRMLLMAGAWDAAAGTLAGAETQIRELPSDLFSGVMEVPVPWSAIGMPPNGVPFDFYVINRAMTEDWWKAMAVDVMPDGANRPGGAWYRVDRATWGWQPEVILGGMPAGRIYDVALVPGRGSEPIRLLALYPANTFTPATHRMAEIIDPWAPIPTPAIYLPFNLRGRP